ncbi:hypothetical protein ACWZJV_05275 [Nocardioides sp. WG-D5]
MIVAIVGLVGVVVGAIVTGGVNYAIARREERFAQRAAVRLLCTDLHKVVAVTESVANDGNWGPEKGPLPTSAYEAHAGTLARMLPSREWKEVEGSVLGVLYLDGIRQELIEGDRSATASELQSVHRIRGFIEVTLRTLDREAWAIKPRPGSETEKHGRGH